VNDAKALTGGAGERAGDRPVGARHAE
jgi:hypothetical protein